MSPLHEQPLQSINGHVEPQPPGIGAIDEFPPREVAANLGLHRPRGRRAMRRYGIPALLVALAVGGGWLGFSRVAASGPKYRTETLQRGALTIAVTATGTLEPLNQVAVGSELSGTIAAVEADFNARVTRGQILARLNPAQLEARVVQSRASLNSALAARRQTRATTAEAQRKLARSEALERRGLLSQQELEIDQAALTRAQAEAQNAQAQIDLARARLEADRTDLSKAVIRSPIDGIVLSRTVEPGQTVAASFQTPMLFTLADDLSRMALHADIDEADIGRVREGQQARFTVDAYPGQTFPARLMTIRNAPQNVENVVTYEAIFKVDNPERRLRPGMTATVEIITHHVQDALLAPNGALRFTPPNDASLATAVPGITPPDRRVERVWVLRDGAPAPIDVATGLSDGRLTEILDGKLEPGVPLLIDVASDDATSRQRARSR